MIYVRLFGGLGNQLFQYATARAISLRLGVDLGLDRRYLQRDPSHLGFALGHFAINAELDPAGLPPHRSRAVAYVLWRAGLGQPRFLRERGLGLNPKVISARDGTYLHGYFQSEDYFSHAIEKIRQELRITTPPSAENREWLDRIMADDQAVSVHVRRGDYVSVAKANATHGTCDPDYYTTAVAEISARGALRPRAYVFSDDPDWARTHLKLGVETVVVGHNGPMQHYEDLRLISACRHHVIANSSFSWWGAWLNPARAKIVIAPKRWFATDKLVNPDILPSNWLRM
jgi:hypothetical protein